MFNLIGYFFFPQKDKQRSNLSNKMHGQATYGFTFLPTENKRTNGANANVWSNNNLIENTKQIYTKF